MTLTRKRQLRLPEPDAYRKLRALSNALRKRVHEHPIRYFDNEALQAVMIDRTKSWTGYVVDLVRHDSRNLLLLEDPVTSERVYMELPKELEFWVPYQNDRRMESTEWTFILSRPPKGFYDIGNVKISWVHDQLTVTFLRGNNATLTASQMRCRDER